MQHVALLTADPGGRKIESQLCHITFVEIDHEIVTKKFLPPNPNPTIKVTKTAPVNTGIGISLNNSDNSFIPYLFQILHTVCQSICKGVSF